MDPQAVNKFHTLYWTQSTPMTPILSQIKPLHTLPPNVFKSILILASPVNLGLLSCICYSNSLTNILCTLLFSPIHVTWPLQPHRLYYIALGYISWYFSTRNSAGVTLINGLTWHDIGIHSYMLYCILKKTDQQWKYFKPSST